MEDIYISGEGLDGEQGGQMPDCPT